MTTLHHEHLVRINDPADGAGQFLTRTQVWEGLRHTILVPQCCDASVDAAHVEQESSQLIHRKIRRGRATLSDWVELTHEESITIHADSASAFAGSTLTMRIEAPEPEPVPVPVPGTLFVRFSYVLQGLERERTAEEDAARCSAYLHSDIERIRQARKFATGDGTKH